jgi:hypothetical protein
VAAAGEDTSYITQEIFFVLEVAYLLPQQQLCRVFISDLDIHTYIHIQGGTTYVRTCREVRKGGVGWERGELNRNPPFGVWANVMPRSPSEDAVHEMSIVETPPREKSPTLHMPYEIPVFPCNVGGAAPWATDSLHLGVLYSSPLAAGVSILTCWGGGL